MCVARPLKQGVRCQLGQKSCYFLLSPWRDKFSKLPKLPKRPSLQCGHAELFFTHQRDLPDLSPLDL